MQKALAHLFENNKSWSEKIRHKQPGFFKKLAHKQSPKYLWIGCADRTAAFQPTLLSVLNQESFLFTVILLILSFILI